MARIDNPGVSKDKNPNESRLEYVRRMRDIKGNNPEIKDDCKKPNRNKLNTIKESVVKPDLDK